MISVNEPIRSNLVPPSLTKNLLLKNYAFQIGLEIVVGETKNLSLQLSSFVFVKINIRMKKKRVVLLA